MNNLKKKQSYFTRTSLKEDMPVQVDEPTQIKFQKLEKIYNDLFEGQYIETAKV